MARFGLCQEPDTLIQSTIQSTIQSPIQSLPQILLGSASPKMRVTALLSTAVALLLASPGSAQLSKKEITKHYIQLDQAVTDYFHVEQKSLDWTQFGGDGSYIEKDRWGHLVVKHILDTDREEILLRSGYSTDDARGYTDYFLQPNGERLLLAKNTKQRFSYSFEGDYFIHNVNTRSTTPLAPDQHGDIQYACWAPRGNKIAYVKGNNLYIWQNGASTRITTDGGPGKYYGIPGFLYEEEVSKSNHLMWFSPDGTKLAYLSLDETELESHEVPFYSTGAPSARAAPATVQLRYSKPGEALPKPTLHILDLENLGTPPEAYPLDDRVDGAIVTEVAWVTDTAECLLIRILSRNQRKETVLLRNLKTKTFHTHRYRSVHSGWLDNYRAIRYLPGSNQYIDISDATGWKHIYLYSAEASSNPIPITRGDWDVDSVLHVDTKNKLVYYTSSERDPSERHVYSIGLNGKNKKMLVKAEEGVWTASFSTGGEYYVLTKEGPQLPFQVVYYTGSTLQKLVGVFNEKKTSRILNKVEGLLSKGTHWHKRIKVLTDNTVLKDRLALHHVPKTQWGRIEVENGVKLTIMEHLPPNFDPKKQYTVVFDVRAPLEGQATLKKFHPVDFHSYLAGHEQLQIIVVTIDVHGSPQRGREFRSSVSGQIGNREGRDILQVARRYKELPYVNKYKMILMGTGYGGFLAAHLTGVNVDLFSSVIMTAPILDWRSYNSIYAERYMGTPAKNPHGYENTAVRLYDGYHNTRGSILVQHTAFDINQHFQNTPRFVQLLREQGVGPRKLQEELYIHADVANDVGRKAIYKAQAEHIFREKARTNSDFTEFHMM
ncbi:DPP6-like protein [Diplocarpon rosae]|nr:DPP6-like protein [Diplocarpon rosae]